MGPAPMIRMVEMSVLLGIELTDWILGTKKGRACCASPKPRARVTLARGVVFRPDSAPAKPPKAPRQPAFCQGFRPFAESTARLRLRYGLVQSVYAFALLKLRRTRFAPPVPRGCATRSPSGRSVEARPGLEPG